MFSCEFCKICKNTFFQRTLLVAISVFPRCYVAKQFFGIAYFTDILSFEKFSKNLHWNLKLIFLFSTLFVHFKISYRQSFIKGRIHCEIFLSEDFMKYSFRVISWNKILSWNTFTLVSNIHCVCFSSIKNCVWREKIPCKI